MNILLLAHEKNLGGASKSLVTLAGELQERGHNVLVVTPFRSGQVYNELKKRNIPMKQIFFTWWVFSEDWSIIYKLAFRIFYFLEWIPVWRLVKLVRKKKIQIIHSNSSVIDVGVRAAQKAEVPHVWHYREFRDFYHFQYISGQKKSKEFMRKMPGTAVFISKNLCDYYKAEIPEKKRRVVYNGIPQQFLYKKYMGENEKSGDTVRFLTAGNFHRNKRQDLAIKACGILYKKGYRNFKLYIAGAVANMEESRKYESELRELAQKAAPDFIEFIGYVSDMITMRKNTDVELVCSDLEAFGRVTVEAMMSSNPVIASDSGANPELVIDSENGYLFAAGDEQQLAEKMQKFLDCPELMYSMGKRAYEYAAREFPSAANTKHMLELYEELIQGGTDKI